MMLKPGESAVVEEIGGKSLKYQLSWEIMAESDRLLKHLDQ